MGFCCIGLFVNVRSVALGVWLHWAFFCIGRFVFRRFVIGRFVFGRFVSTPSVFSVHVYKIKRMGNRFKCTDLSL